MNSLLRKILPNDVIKFVILKYRKIYHSKREINLSSDFKKYRIHVVHDVLYLNAPFGGKLFIRSSHNLNKEFINDNYIYRFSDNKITRIDLLFKKYNYNTMIVAGEYMSFSNNRMLDFYKFSNKFKNIEEILSGEPPIKIPCIDLSIYNFFESKFYIISPCTLQIYVYDKRNITWNKLPIIKKDNNGEFHYYTYNNEKLDNKTITVTKVFGTPTEIINIKRNTDQLDISDVYISDRYFCMAMSDYKNNSTNIIVYDRQSFLIVNNYTINSIYFVIYKDLLFIEKEKRVLVYNAITREQLYTIKTTYEIYQLIVNTDILFSVDADTGIIEMFFLNC